MSSIIFCPFIYPMARLAAESFHKSPPYRANFTSAYQPAVVFNFVS